MARYRKIRRRVSSNRSASKRIRSKRSSGGMLSSSGALQIDAMLYGAVREKASNFLAPYVAKVPFLGQLSDEVAMGVIDYYVGKKTSGLLSNVARKGLVVENARVGEYLAQGILSGNTQTAAASGYMYG